jgi:queuine tRNA-ribosyltransferase
LIDIGFDGYGFGGWPFDGNGDFDYRIAQVIADVTPADKPRFALGVGSPENMVRLRAMGYDIFDCVLPTRDARHQRLYVLTQPLNTVDFSTKKKWYGHLYLDRGSLANDFSPIDAYCQCPTCQHYTKAYLHHLFKIKDNLAFQLAVTHNLWFYAQLMEKLKQL